MQLVIVEAFGGPEQLRVAQEAAPHTAAGELLVDVEAAGINYIDVYQREGKYRTPLPFGPGLEGVGRIVEIGRGGDVARNDFTVGQRIAWINVPGSYAEKVVVPAARAVAVADQLTTGQALLFQSLTAQYLVSEYGEIRPGVRVLVHSAAGGLGLLLVQWFKHLGAWVVGTTSSDAKAAVARAAGADAVINYGSDYAFADEVMALTGGRGVELAIDGVGAKTLEATLTVLARGGTAVSIGSASGLPPSIDPGKLGPKCLRLAGGSIFSYTAEPTELQRRSAIVTEAIRAGWLRPDEGTAYPLEKAADAHRDLESRNAHGKLYLRPGVVQP